jgi:hypothetical protein
MKTTMAKQGTYLGTGAGMVLFGLFGLMPSCLVGGAAGLTIAGMLFGLPVGPGLLGRMIVLASMLMGIVVSCAVTVMASSSVGWLIGSAVATIQHDLEVTKRR